MVDQPPKVSLTDAVQAIRSALLAAVTDLASEEVQFALGSVELEFAIEFQLRLMGKSRSWYLRQAQVPAHRRLRHNFTG